MLICYSFVSFRTFFLLTHAEILGYVLLFVSGCGSVVCVSGKPSLSVGALLSFLISPVTWYGT